MRLLIVEPEYSGHRMVSIVRAVVTEAVSRGWNVFLITSREAINHPSVMLIQKDLGSVKVEVIPMEYKRKRLQAPWLGVFGSLLGQVFYYLSIKKALRENVAYINPDFVYMPTLDSCDKVISILGSPAMGVPFGGVMMAPKFHRYKLYREPKSRNDTIYEYLFRRLLKSRYIAFVWLFDKRLLMYFQEHYTAMESAKVKFIPDHGEINVKMDRRTSRNRLGLADGSLVVLVYGSLSMRKGIKQLFTSTKDFDNIHILLAGVADEETRDFLRSDLARHFASTQRLTSQLFFHDDIKESEVFFAADICWLGYVGNFSQSSGVLYQAASVGLPVIASKGSLLGRLVSDHKLGQVVDPTDRTEVSAALRLFSSRPDLVKEIGLSGKRLAAGHTRKAHGAAVCDLVESVALS